MNDRNEFMIEYAEGFGVSRRFAMYGLNRGDPVHVGPCAKALARQAFIDGADSVRHAYDLNLDDCEHHTTRRFR